MTNQGTGSSSDEHALPLRELSHLILDSTNELRDHLKLSDEEFVGVAGTAFANIRSYYLYGALDEVEKVGLELIRLEDFLGDSAIDPKSGRVDRLMLAIIVEQLQVRIRRLQEVLTQLVLFCNTNEQQYFRQLLLLEELEDLDRSNRDLQVFDGAISQNIAVSTARLCEELLELSERVDGERAWYATSKGKRVGPERPRSFERLQSSMAQRVRSAFGEMFPAERIAFGMSYQGGFGKASEALHFAASGKAYRIRVGDERRGLVQAGLLALACIGRVHMLLGEPESERCHYVHRLVRNNTVPAEIVRGITVRNILAGDFVVAMSKLAEVLDVHESQYGHRSYRVRFLEAPMLEGAEEDVIPARYVRKLIDKGTTVLRANEKLRELGLSEDEIRGLDGLPEVDVQDALRQSLIRLWSLGMREAVLFRADASASDKE